MLIALAVETGIKEKLYPYFLESKRAATIVPLVLCFFIAALSTRDVVSFDTGLIGIVCAVLVFFASYDRNLILPIPILRPVLLWVGSRSFAIYLTHMIAYWVTVEAFYRAYPGVHFDARFTVPFAVVALGLVVLLSDASYRLIERPLRDRGRVYARQYRARRASGPAPNVSIEIIEPAAVRASGPIGAGIAPASLADPTQLVSPAQTGSRVGLS